MSKTKITAKVLSGINPSNVQVIIRKTIIDDNNKMIQKYGLTNEGSWVVVPELGEYPEECWLPVEVYNV